MVLVHGFAGSSAIWFAIRRALCGDGRVVVRLDDPPWASSMDRLADRLIDAVEDVLAVTGAGKVHLVGHSLGGVVIALALTGRRLAGRVDLEVTATSRDDRVNRRGEREPPRTHPQSRPRPGVAAGKSPAAALGPGGHTATRPAHGEPPNGVPSAGPAHRQPRALMIDADGHSGMMLDPDVAGADRRSAFAPRGRC